jgi:beta-mannosidase
VISNLVDLHAGWHLAEVSHGADAAAIASVPEGDWLAATVPGSVHGALLSAGRIPDPFQGTNEQRVAWVAERTWAWRLRFEGGELAAHEDLVFEGLDTYCRVWLNGTLLFDSDNMFVPCRVDVRAMLNAGANELVLRFDPPLARAREVEAGFGKRQLWNGDSARLYARKAQYHFGWDWGPCLLTSGPWKAIRRHGWQVRIGDVDCRTTLDVAAARASLDIRVDVVAAPAGAVVEFELLDPEGRRAGLVTTSADAAQGRLEIADARLWWPHGQGAQALYTLITRVVDGTTVQAEDRRRIGLRSLRLRQAAVDGETGRSFCFEVNGREIFIGGANWIPDDSLLERITPDRYRERVAQAAAANMNMLRVWGGGIYEDEAFYDACDELGLLVWQDFMFACGMYPAHPAFLDSVAQEARAAVTRLRHRASLAIWCGNNEDYAVAESIGAHGPSAPPGRFDAREIYERLLPRICSELDADRPYWPGSPYSPDPDGITLSSDATVGDRHSWEVWHQQMLPYQRYAEVQARFVSEFGMQSAPSLTLLESVLPPSERYPESRTMQWHNKAGSGSPDGFRRLAAYLADNLRAGATLADYVYDTQFVQAEAMRYAYQDFRRRWQAAGARAVGGALVWQLNDCWPATSWALIDSSGAAKPAWHVVRRALAPLSVALRLESGAARLAIMNAGPAVQVRLELGVFSLDGRLRATHRLELDVLGNQSTELVEPVVAIDGGAVVGELVAYVDGREVARDCAWPEPYKSHDFSPAGLQLAMEDRGLVLQADRPMKGVWLEAQGTRFADNFIDLMPHSARRVECEFTPMRGVCVRALGCGSRLWKAPESSTRLEEPAMARQAWQEAGGFLHGGMGSTRSS